MAAYPTIRQCIIGGQLDGVPLFFKSESDLRGNYV